MVVHFGLNNHAYCGTKNGITTTNFNAVTCKRCMKKKRNADEIAYLESKFPGMKSDEERDFARWALEAESMGHISNIRYEPRTFQLSDPVNGWFLSIGKRGGSKLKKRHAMRGSTYTPDFSFVIDWLFPGSDFFLFRELHSTIWIDTKGIFTNRQNDFPVKSKWLYQKYGIFVQKVIPEKLFTKTFKPGRIEL